MAGLAILIFMFFAIGKNRIFICLALYLVFAVTGAITFSMAEAFSLDELTGSRSGPGVFLLSIDYTVDCLAGYSASISKDDRHSSYAARGGALRVFAPWFYNSVMRSACYAPPAAKQYRLPALNNSVPLKLRI